MRVLLLTHPSLRPDRKNRKRSDLQTEWDVWRGLLNLGHKVEILGLQEGLEELQQSIKIFRPNIVFNLLEEFRHEACFDFLPVAFLESQNVPFTGCNPRGLALARPKHIAKAVAKAAGFLTPDSILIKKTMELPKNLKFPLIVKLNREDASLGLKRKNVAYNHADLKKCAATLIKKYQSELLIESFIPGRDITVGILGNNQPKVLPPWQLHLPSPQHISSEVIKFSAKTRFKQGLRAMRASGISANLQKQLQKQAVQIFNDLELSGYARMDFRVTEDEQIFFLEANPNPNLARKEDFAAAALRAGISFDQLLTKILSLGQKYKPRI